MEKQRRKSKYRLFIRLLILGIVFFNGGNVFSQTMREKINGLEIVPVENQTFYDTALLKRCLPLLSFYEDAMFFLNYLKNVNKALVISDVVYYYNRSNARLW